MDKKAIISFDVVMWIIKVIIIGIVISIVGFIIYMLVVNDVGVENLRSQEFVERSLSSPDCFSYHDKYIGRYYSNVIDIDNFNEKRLSECIDYGNKNIISAKFTLSNLDKPEEDANVTYYNKEDYNRWLPFSFGEKYYKKINNDRYVLIKDDKIYPGKLQIEVVTVIG